MFVLKQLYRLLLKQYSVYQLTQEVMSEADDVTVRVSTADGVLFIVILTTILKTQLSTLI